MAKTIGKDKGSLTRARRARRVESAPAGDPSNDEPRDEDMQAADEATDTAMDTDANADVDMVDMDAPADTDEAETASERRERRAVALGAESSVARRPVVTVARGGGRHAPAWMHNNGATRFIAESIDELFKVTWPTPQDAWNMTLVVIAVSAFVAVLLGAADAALIRALEWVVSLSQPATPTH